MAEQVDIAVDLGVVPPPLREILSLRQLVEVATDRPRQIIEAFCTSSSKSNKGWCLLGLPVSVPSGQKSWRRFCGYSSAGSLLRGLMPAARSSSR